MLYMPGHEFIYDRLDEHAIVSPELQTTIGNFNRLGTPAVYIEEACI